MEDLAMKYKKTCMKFIAAFPRSRLFVSLIFPTKSEWLNRACNDLNKRLIEIVNDLKSSNGARIDFIEHFYLLDSKGCLDPTLGRYINHLNSGLWVPKFVDKVHLGKSGIRLFVRALKGKVIRNYKNPVGSSQPISGRRLSQRQPPPEWDSSFPHPTLSREQQWSWPPLVPKFPPPPPFPPLGLPPSPPGVSGYVDFDHHRASSSDGTLRTARLSRSSNDG